MTDSPAGGKVDVYCTQPHYGNHLAPIWFGLPADRRGTWWAGGLCADRGNTEGVPNWRRGEPRGDHPCLVAGWMDENVVRGPTIYLEHGSGQTYRGDPDSPHAATHESYSGSDGHDRTVLFLCPSETVADRWRTRYPNVPAVAVGAPKLDWWHSHPGAGGGGPHPVLAVTFHCLVGDTIASGPPVVSSGSRWYEGELVRVTVSGGDEISCTPNHPVLTPSGWVAAGMLSEGDYVIGGPPGERMVRGLNPDDLQRPARIEDITRPWDQGSAVGAVSVPTAPEDFHGDGVGSKVHVVRTYRDLRVESEPGFGQPRPQRSLCIGDRVPALAFGDRSGCQTGRGLGGTPVSRLEPFLAPFSLLCCPLGRTNQGCLGQRALHSFPFQHPVNGGSGHAQTGGYHLAGFPRSVSNEDRVFLIGDDGRPFQTDFSLGADSDPSRPESPVDSFPVRAVLSGKVGSAFASQIAANKIVRIERHHFTGFVHSLQTSEGWHLANGIVVANSDNRLISEAVSAWRHYEPGLTRAVDRLRAAGWQVLGHGHPRLWQPLRVMWGQLGVEAVEDFGEILSRADVLAVDNSSVLYEFASTGRPVVVMNAPWFRRNIHHGLRFWDLIPGAQIDGPGKLPDAAVAALAETETAREIREEVTRRVYVATDGKATDRAVAAILGVLARRASTAG